MFSYVFGFPTFLQQFLSKNTNMQVRKTQRSNDGYVTIKEIASYAAQCKKVGGKKEILRLT